MNDFNSFLYHKLLMPSNVSKEKDKVDANFHAFKKKSNLPFKVNAMLILSRMMIIDED